jgi:DNA adenine methylase
MLSEKPLLSPLRYPGSKRRIAKYVSQALELNGLKPSLYVEPFLGGGSVALQLLQDQSVKQVLLMDIDPWIASFWKTVFFHTEWLIEQIESTDVTLDQWMAIRKSNPKTIYEKAWAGFFLNRTSFSGILESKAGPLGGKEQSSENKIDCRFPRATLIERIQRIAAYKEKVFAIWCVSWDVGITRMHEKQTLGILPKEDLFFYFDPPFFEKANKLYRYYFEDNDHKRLRNFLLKLEDKWLLSYDSADQVFSLYGNALNQRTNGAKHDHIELLYSISVTTERKKAKEVVLTNLEILPEKAH